MYTAQIQAKKYYRYKKKSYFGIKATWIETALLFGALYIAFVVLTKKGEIEINEKELSVIAAVILWEGFQFLRRIYSFCKRVKKYTEYQRSDIHRVDRLNGYEFEHYLAAHFKLKGYKVILTPPQNDFGVDLVLVKKRERIAVQAKRYNHEAGYKVNYRAVQEVAAGKAYYNCNKGIVVTNSFFTNSAKELAKVNNVDLWDRQRMIKEFQRKTAPKLNSYKNPAAL